MPDLTLLEAAEIIMNPRGYGTSERNAAECMAASCLHAIAAGEYKQVVHARWILHETPNRYRMWWTCSHCDTTADFYKSSKYCLSCGALMDGKDDNHERV